MTVDTSHLEPDELVRRFPAECNFDDDSEPEHEGACIAVFMVLLLLLVAIASCVAAIY